MNIARWFSLTMGIAAAASVAAACGDDEGSGGAGGTETGTGSGTTTSDGGDGTGGDGTGGGGTGGDGTGGGACLMFGASCAVGVDTCCDAAGETGECFAFGMGARCTIPCPADPADCPNNGAGCNNMNPSYCKTN